METYIGTKQVKAKPMNRGDYNTYRGWVLPENECAEDEGYLVEYLDGGKPNDNRHLGYISWSPKQQFENAYLTIGNLDNRSPHQQRVIAEKVLLDSKVDALNSFIEINPLFNSLDSSEQERLERQSYIMRQYSDVLSERIKAF